MGREESLRSPVPLDTKHDIAHFDCGVAALNVYLQKYAYLNQRNRSARTYVATVGAQVVGYYTLAAGSVSPAESPPRVIEGLGRYPVPVILLARLAVDRAWQGRSLGRALLKDAVLRATQAAEIIGSRAILTHAKDEQAKQFYMKYGFEPSPTDGLHLFLSMKDVRKTLGKDQ